MQNLKTPMGTVKKGIAHFKNINTQSITAVNTPLNLFEGVIINNSNNITKVSNTQLLLKAGITYKLTGVFVPVTFSPPTTGYCSYVWKDYTSNIVISTIAYVFPITNTVDSWSTNPSIECFFTPTIDSLVGLTTYADLVGTCSTTGGYSYALVEELEAYLIPTDPTKYTDVINYTSATGSVLIPSGLPVGTKKLIRKLNSSQGTVAITCTGETFTSSNLASVTLNSDGDFWLVEKVNATRWDLTDGKESGSNANGKWYKLYNGRIEARRNMPQVTTMADGSFSLDMPIQPLSGASVHSRTFLKNHTNNGIAANNILISPWNATNWGIFCAYRISDGARISNTTIPFGVGHTDEVVCESIWY